LVINDLLTQKLQLNNCSCHVSVAIVNYAHVIFYGRIVAPTEFFPRTTQISYQYYTKIEDFFTSKWKEKIYIV